MGRIVSTTYGDETVRAYVPPPLSPVPPIELSGLMPLIEQANRPLAASQLIFDRRPHYSCGEWERRLVSGNWDLP